MTGHFVNGKHGERGIGSGHILGTGDHPFRGTGAHPFGTGNHFF